MDLETPSTRGNKIITTVDKIIQNIETQEECGPGTKNILIETQHADLTPMEEDCLLKSDDESQREGWIKTSLYRQIEKEKDRGRPCKSENSPQQRW